MKRCVVSVALLFGLVGCASSSAYVVPPNEGEVSCVHCSPQGMSEYVWEEPMVDVVDVPPGLDPDGVYYRPAHRQVVEVKQGKYRHYQGR